VKAVSITSLEKPPYQASVDFERIFYALRERTETKRVLYTAHFVHLPWESSRPPFSPATPGARHQYFRRTPSGRGAAIN
jgi:hypothetical protein